MRTYLAVLLLGLSIGLTATWAAEGAVPLFVLTKAAEPAIDGRLDETCWKSARQFPLRHYAGGELKVGGRAALSWDAAGL
jgi:hypothetical protein